MDGCLYRCPHPVPLGLRNLHRYHSVAGKAGAGHHHEGGALHLGQCRQPQAGGSVLVVSQFTLAADTARGMRPSFSKGASPDRAEALYDYFVERCRQQEMNTQTGRFAADMQVSLVNDGPVTFWLQV